MTHDMVEHIKTFIDLASISVLLATLIEKMPEISAFFTTIWVILRIYEWFENRNKRKRKR